MKRIEIILIALILSFPVSSKEYHVAKTGNDNNNGEMNTPFLSIQAAANMAQPGDIITVHEGIYRERVNPPRGGTSEGRRIVYQAARGEKVAIKGSEVVKNWEKAENDTWKVTLPNIFFGDFNPYIDIIHGEWYKTPMDGYDRHTGAIYLDEQWLTEAGDLDKVLQPAGEKPLWFAEVNDQNTTLWAQFKGIDPNKELVEINVRQSIFYPDEPGRNYITVRGFTMCHAATPWSGAQSEQIGLIGTHWSKGWIIENNVISYSMNTGITLGHYKLNNIPLPPATAPGFIHSIELALERGWSKQEIGSHVIRNNHISHCEKNGIHGSLGGIFSTIKGNTLCDIALQGWISGPDVAGLKLLGSQDVIISHNHMYRCGGFGAIWLDWMAQGTRVSGNLLHDNSRDLFVEVNHGPFLVDNNLLLSSEGLLDWSGGGAYVHNLFACQIKIREELVRETPFHKAHSTEMGGLSKVVGDDERFHNNLFIGHGGLSVYNEWEALNLQASGNVYLSGAKPSSHDHEALVIADVDPGISLKEDPGGWLLEISVDSSWVSAQQNRILVTTEVLGKAMVPNVPYEKPDGTPYLLKVDYFGKNRNTENPDPGPFQISGVSKILLKVWPLK